MYHYGMDIWAAGVTLAEMMFNQGHAFLRGTDNNDQLLKISEVFGTEGLLATMMKYNLPLSPFYQKNLVESDPINLESLIDDSNRVKVTKEALDLLKKML